MIQTIQNSLRLIKPRERILLGLLLLVRVALNFLDILGVALIGLVGALFAARVAGSDSFSFLSFSFSPRDSSEFLLVLAAVIALVFVMKFVLAALVIKRTVVFLANIEARVGGDIASFLFEGELERLKKTSRGEAHFAGIDSAHLAVTGVLTSLFSLVSESALFLAVFVLFIVVDPVVASLASLYLVTLIVSFQYFASRRIKKLGEGAADAQVALTDTIGDLNAGFRENLVLGATSKLVRQFRSHGLRKARAVGLHYYYLTIPRYFIETALMIGVLLLGVWQVLAGDIQDGAVTTSVFLAGGVKMIAALLPIQTAFSNAKFYAAQAGPAQSLGLSAQLESAGSSLPGETRARRKDVDLGFTHGFSVEIEDVTFKHSDAHEPVLKNVSLSISPGSHVALVGPSGAGKSTLVDLIMGINHPSTGSIWVNGARPRSYYSNLPGGIGYVPQVPGLLSGSIAENIALGIDPNEISEDEVLRCIKVAQLEGFVDSLPEGIHTSIGKQLDALSVGQRQRLGVARALYFSPRLLVLDEVTSALDPETEFLLTEGLRHLGSRLTLITIAHRLSTIKHADVVCLIDRGQIQGSGTFETLRRTVPLFERFLQLADFKP